MTASHAGHVTASHAGHVTASPAGNVMTSPAGLEIAKLPDTQGKAMGCWLGNLMLKSSFVHIKHKTVAKCFWTPQTLSPVLTHY